MKWRDEFDEQHSPWLVTALNHEDWKENREAFANSGTITAKNNIDR